MWDSLVRLTVSFIYWWQVWWDHGLRGQGLCARQIAIGWSIVIPLQCLDREPACVALDWLVAWVGVMGLMLLSLFNNFSFCLLSFTEKSPKHHWFSYSIIGRSGRMPWFKKAMVSLSCHNKWQHSILQIRLPDGTLGKFFLTEVWMMHVCLSQPLTEVKRSAASWSHCGKLGWMYVHIGGLPLVDLL